MEVRWVGSRSSSSIPVYVSTNPSDINPRQLGHLYSSCGHSPSRRLPAHPLDLTKLRLALSRSAVVVSVFTHRPRGGASPLLLGLGRRLKLPLIIPQGERELVAFGRAVSDLGLTASIYDVMVIPSLRRMGIGKMVVRRIVRMLTSRDIYDIAALCSPDHRPFFQACGFGDDILGSTTMMLAGVEYYAPPQ